MRDFKAFLPLLLLAVATRAIPVPEPQSIALVSAHAAVESGAVSTPIEKREVNLEEETTEAEEEVTTEEVHETEEEPVEKNEEEDEGKDEGKNEEASEAVATTEGLEGVHEDAEEEVKKEEEKATEGESEDEKTEEKEEEARGGEEDAEGGKEEGASKEEEKEEKEVGVEEEVPLVSKEEEEGVPLVSKEEEEGVEGEHLPPFPLFPGRHPIDGRVPWPWGPLPPLGHHSEDLPDHGVVQLGGNEVWTPRKVVVPIYVIRFDPRYFPAPGPFHSA